MTTDGDLREHLVQLAESIEIEDRWPSIASQTRASMFRPLRHKRRVSPVVAIVPGIVLILAATGLVLMSHRSPEVRTRTSNPSADGPPLQPSAQVPVGTLPADPGQPPTFLGMFLSSNSVLTRGSTDGLSPTGDAIDVSPEVITDFTVSRDGSTAYISVYPQPGTSRSTPLGRIERVDLTTGSRALVVADGTMPAISPDGRKLAYNTGREPGATNGILHERDLVTGAERTWTGPVSQMSWSPDGRILAFQGSSKSHGREVRILDTEAAGASLDQARLLGPRPPANGYWASPAFRADGRLAVVIFTGGGVGTAAHKEVDLVDPNSGEVLQTLTTANPGTQINLDWDASGHHLLIAGDNVVAYVADANGTREVGRFNIAQW